MNAWMHVAGWVLVHFLWQGTTIALVAAVVLRVCRRRSSVVRYGIACGTLLTLLASAIVTAALVDANGMREVKPEQRVRVLIARQSRDDAALPIDLDRHPPSSLPIFSR